MKVAIYARISTGDQNVDTQIRICSTFCAQRDFEVYEVYEDTISGTKASRPAFNKLLEDMRMGKFEAVCVTKLDRIGRSLQHLLGLIDEFNSKKIQFMAVTQNIDTTSSMGKFQVQILGAFAEFERNLISERTKEGLVGKKNVGKRGKDKKPRKWRIDKGVKRGGRKKLSF